MKNNTRWADEYGLLRLRWFLAGGVAALLLLIVGITTAVYVTDRNRCAAYERETGRATRFVRWTFTTWDCLTQTSDGKWLPIDQLRDEVGP